MNNLTNLHSKHKSALLFFCIPLIVLLLAGCSPVKKALQIKGSDTMVNLGQAWAEVYLNQHPEANIAVNGGGSGTGISALIAGVADIAQSSRDMEEKEFMQAKTNGVEPKVTHVANDGIVIIVNPHCPINKLSVPQLSAIFAGKIRNWREVGGADQKIVALSRERNSGTHVFFLQQVVKLGKKKNLQEFAPEVLMMPSSEAIVEEVAVNPSAIGYIGLGYLSPRVKGLAVAKDANSPYVKPNIATVLNKTYCVARPLYFYTNGVPTGDAKSFIDFVLSPEGQKIVLNMDFVPVKK